MTARNHTLIAAASTPEATAILRAAFPNADAENQNKAAQHRTPITLSDTHTLIITGIGKTNAAATIAAYAAQHPQTKAIINLGIAGTYAAEDDIAKSILADPSLFADEGLQTEATFQTCADLGFPISDAPQDHFPPHPSLADQLTPIADLTAPIATVSTCSGTHALAHAAQERTNARAETMEGAAAALAAHHAGIPFAELRVISNTTGDRASQVWDIKAALAKLADLTKAIIAAAE